MYHSIDEPREDGYISDLIHYRMNATAMNLRFVVEVKNELGSVSV